ncbi:hypothetical protein GHT06_009323 [Daphnia sinensis]|uniref:Dopamine N-acetyltransferase n=1 Tax=Daphnia sinensis TaxID=1820382 RepID=A0AAD5PZ57_9CRUS|nr:hypothetical protein GHT06_009323 [Daphnia sinensis]
MSSFPRKFFTKDGQVFTIDIGRIEELDEVIEFLRINFFSTSPNCYLVSDWNGTSDSDRMSDYLSSCLRHPVSLTVRDSAGRLVAVRLNELEAPEDVHLDSLTSQTKRRLITALLTDLEAGINLFTTFNTDKVLSLAMMAVDKNYCKLGLATTLVGLSLELGKANGAGAVKVCAVSQYAAKVAAKHGLETLRTIDYATYEFEGGKPLAHFDALLAEHPVAAFLACRLT